MKKALITFNIGLLITILIAITLSSTKTFDRFSKIQKSMEQVENATQQESSSLEDSIYNFIKNMNIAHPDIAFAMAKLESANFTSKIFREQNNLFGMRESFKRPYIRDSVVNGYSSYANWKESIIDYALWQTYSAKNMERNAFLQLLQQTYAEDSTYIQTINKLIKNNN